MVWGHVRAGFSLAVLFELGFEMNENSWGNGEVGENILGINEDVDATLHKWDLNKNIIS